ncbi:hypothetical protein LPJ64_000920 [Coemansia asiatica]|uniref:Uncharacterized protein n=1 Tax=Coemansia asiatica TaxID=1052880 RepID=A0A9W7XQ16_9FUNG|nr:hypothetical protein LPJ64_000920 [Coemansia asiatica]
MDGPTIRDYIDARKKSGMSWDDFRALKDKSEANDFSDSAMLAWRKQLDAEREARLNRARPISSDGKAGSETRGKGDRRSHRSRKHRRRDKDKDKDKDEDKDKDKHKHKHRHASRGHSRSKSRSRSRSRSRSSERDRRHSRRGKGHKRKSRYRSRSNSRSRSPGCKRIDTWQEF